MRKLLFIILSFGVIVLVFFVFFFTSKKQPISPPPFASTPTPLPLPPNTATTGLAIVSTTPTNNSSDVNVNQQIIIMFNRPVLTKDFSFTIGPDFPYTTTFTGNQFTVTPTTPLDPGTAYYYTIQFADGTFSQKYYFTTAGSGPITNPQYDNVGGLNNAGYKILKPDLYLSNQTPYQGSDFSVTYHVSNVPDTHFVFEVTLTGADSTQSKQDFIAWLHSLGLQDAQIQQIEITYM